MSAYFIFDPFTTSYESFVFGWNEFWKVPYFSQVLSTPSGTILRKILPPPVFIPFWNQMTHTKKQNRQIWMSLPFYQTCLIEKIHIYIYIYIYISHLHWEWQDTFNIYLGQTVSIRLSTRVVITLSKIHNMIINCYYLEYSGYWPNFYCHIHNASFSAWTHSAVDKAFGWIVLLSEIILRLQVQSQE